MYSVFKIYFGFLLLFTFCCVSSFSQKKPVVKSVIIEEIVYEYDTVYVNDIKYKLDTLFSPKPITSLLAVPVSDAALINNKKPETKKSSLKTTQIGGKFNAPLLSIFKRKTPVRTKSYYPQYYQSEHVFFVSCFASGFTTGRNFFNDQTTSVFDLKSSSIILPTSGVGFGMLKKSYLFAVNVEYKHFFEKLQATSPISWSDTLDNGNEIFYRNIQGYLKTEIKNHYQFIHLNTSIGYKFGASAFSITPLLLFGAGYSLYSKNYKFGSQNQKVEEVTHSNKVKTFFTFGINCPLGFNFNNGVAFYLTPEWQHSFIKKNIYPVKYNDSFSLKLCVVYTIKKKVNANSK